jgi:uroporphyrinogen decarboxylase
MNSRERVECAIRFEAPDRVPFNFWMDRRRMAELDEKYGADFRLTRYDADVIESHACIPAFPRGEHQMRDGTAWMVSELFVDWAETPAVPMPDPKAPVLYDWLDYHLANHPDKAVIVNSPNVLTLIEGMRKQENLYVDFCMYPEAVKTFFGRISDVMAAVAEEVCRRDITALYVQDDVAFNNGLLMPIAQWRELVYPHWKKVIDVAHAHEKPVFFHTDGKVDALWDAFHEDLGVRMLNPLQPELQDLGKYKERFDGKMGVYGGLQTGALHTMTPDEIRAHVEDLFEKCGRGGGLIMSTHDIDYSITDAQLDVLVNAIQNCVY